MPQVLAVNVCPQAGEQQLPSQKEKESIQKSFCEEYPNEEAKSSIYIHSLWQGPQIGTLCLQTQLHREIFLLNEQPEITRQLGQTTLYRGTESTEGRNRNTENVSDNRKDPRKTGKFYFIWKKNSHPAVTKKKMRC